jgi:long-chain acyl-CoA synthetase
MRSMGSWRGEWRPSEQETNLNISTILDMAAEAFGERTALVCGGQRLSYAELRAAAWRAARRIADANVKYVGLLDVNSPAAPIALFGAAYAGVPYVPLNYRLTAAEIGELIDRITPCLLVTGPEYVKLAAPRAGLTVVERATFAGPHPTPPPQAGEGEGVQAPEDPRAVAVQIFTSGTTGKPKAAILRHENLMSYIVGTIEFASAGEDEAVIVAVPPYHIAGISANLSATYACRRMVQLEGFEARAWTEAAARERVTNAFLVPTMLSRILDELDARPDLSLDSLRAVAYGGGKMPLSTIRRAMQRFPKIDFTNAYGLTETSATIAVLGPQDHRDAVASSDPAVQKRLGSIGRATGAVEIQVRGDDGAVLPAGETGMIFARGGQVAGEYQQQGSLLDGDGWFCTRDRGYMDADGFLFLDGRADDVIVRGGENISPGEIEEVLLAHPAIADAAVVAIPDEQWGEGVAAAVVLKNGAQASVEELQASVKARLRSSRVPQRIVFRRELPYNELGKVLRRVIRQELAAQP